MKNSIYKYFLHKDIMSVSHNEYSKYIILLNALFITIVAIAIYTIYLFLRDINIIKYIVLLGFFINCFAVLYLKFGDFHKSKVIASNIFIFSLLVLFIVSFILSFSNNTTPAIIWFGIFPLITSFCLSQKKSFIWTFIYVILGIIITVYMHNHKITFGIYTLAKTYHSTLMDIVLAPSISILFVFFFIKAQSNLIRSVEKNLAQKNMFLKILSHDITNSIQLMSIVAKKLSNDEYIKDKYQKKLKQLNKSIEIITEITTDIRCQLISNISAEDQKNSLNILNMQEVYNELQIVFSEKLKAKNIEFIAGDHLQEISFSANHMILFSNVLQNLILNSIKFSSYGGKIKFDVINLSTSKVKISIQDNGVGITKEKSDKLFSSSYNDSTIGTAGEKGTGFGINIVALGVKELGGEIKVSSSTNPETSGTRFDIILPISLT